MNKLSNHSLKSFIDEQFNPDENIYESFPKLCKKIHINHSNNKELLYYIQSNNNNTTTTNMNFIECGDKSQINDIISNRYSLNNNWYQLGTNKKDNVLKSLLYILDNNLVNDDDIILEKYIYHLRNKMGLELDTKKYFQIYEYKKQKYKKCDMKDVLLNYKKITNDVLHYFADYFKVNIIVINYKINTNYRVINNFCKDRGNCFLIEFENDLYQPILNKNGENIYYNKECQY